MIWFDKKNPDVAFVGRPLWMAGRRAKRVNA